MLAGYNSTLAGQHGTLAGPNGTLAGYNSTLAGPNGTLTGPNGTLTSPNGTLTGPNGMLAGYNSTIANQYGTLALPNGTLASPNAMLAGSTGTLAGPTSTGEKEARLAGEEEPPTTTRPTDSTHAALTGGDERPAEREAQPTTPADKTSAAPRLPTGGDERSAGEKEAQPTTTPADLETSVSKKTTKSVKGRPSAVAASKASKENIDPAGAGSRPIKDKAPPKSKKRKVVSDEDTAQDDLPLGVKRSRGMGEEGRDVGDDNTGLLRARRTTKLPQHLQDIGYKPPKKGGRGRGKA
jgi:hypothetical protein